MFLTFVINTVLISVAVVIHYEILRLLSTVIPKLSVQNRLRVIIGVFGTITAHVIEIWMFGIAFFLMTTYGDFGSLQGNYSGTILDSVYFSFTNYTSLGIGDIEPLGDIRFLAGLEALTGLAMITWSASFMFIEMRKFWD
ncbi:MAG: two pore domain potassium channel family protein [Gammaproteobacteria bacterium]|nr:two pore domain potassium channel family protein [Gammaproteobacteria bacterium]